MGIIGDIGEELKPLGNVAVQQIAPKKPAHNPIEQVEKDPSHKVEQNAQGTSESDNKEFLEALYGSSKAPEVQGSKAQSPEEQKSQEALQKELEGKTPEEQQEIIKKRQELAQMHKETYYDPLVQKVEQLGKKQEDFETKVERVERLEMEDLQEKKEKDEKKKPIAVDMAERTTEAHRGTTG